MSLYQYGDTCTENRGAPGFINVARAGLADHADTVTKAGFGTVDWAQICQRAGILLNAPNGLCIQHQLPGSAIKLQAVYGVFDSEILDALKEAISAHILADLQPNRFQRADDFRQMILNYLPHMVGAARDCHCLVMGFGLGSDSFMLLALIRPGSAATFQPEDLGRAKALCAFIRDSVQKPSALHIERSLQPSFKLFLDRLPFGIISLNEQQQLEFLNRNAQILLAQNDGLIRAQQSIAATNMHDNNALHAALAHCGANVSQWPAAQILLIQRKNQRRPLSVTVQAKSPDDKAAGILLYIVDPNIDTSATIGQICAAYGLTPVEIELTCHIISGMTLQEGARALRIKPDTARGYLKRIFGKLGVNRQAELVRLLLSSFIPSSSEMAANNSGSWRNPNGGKQDPRLGMRSSHNGGSVYSKGHIDI